MELVALLERLSRVLVNDAHAHGLKPTQWEALRFLARANRFSRTPSALTLYLGTTKGTVSQTVSALERKGLLAKETDPSDRRAVNLSLTKEGRQLLRKDPLGKLSKICDELPAAEQAAAANALRALLRGTLEARGRTPFGECATCRHFRPDVPQGAPHWCGLLEVSLSKRDAAQICTENEDAA
ncbi:MAG: MarR family transcriptional regulator [Myxococcota bacterium]